MGKHAVGPRIGVGKGHVRSQVTAGRPLGKVGSPQTEAGQTCSRAVGHAGNAAQGWTQGLPMAQRVNEKRGSKAMHRDGVARKVEVFVRGQEPRQMGYGGHSLLS